MPSTKYTSRNDWTNGLSTMAANALKRADFESKEQVLSAFRAGKVFIKAEGGGSSICQLGKKGIAEVRVWLGLHPENASRRHRPGAIASAITVLQESGYTVIPPEGDPNGR